MPTDTQLEPTVETNPVSPKVIDPFSLPTSFERITALIDQNRFTLMPGQLVARIDLCQSFGSILLPEQAQSETNTATVVLAAPDLDAALYHEGVRILPIQSAGRELCSRGNERLVLYDVATDLHAVFLEE